MRIIDFLNNSFKLTVVIEDYLRDYGRNHHAIANKYNLHYDDDVCKKMFIVTDHNIK